MLRAHLQAVESNLIQISQIPANAGHTLHRGTPREAFIREFLETHLSANVAIGTGEIIDADSQPRGQRNQYDIVVYKRNFPKLHFGGGVNGFLIESVVATIEVKSLLDETAVEKSLSAAHNAKRLTPHIDKVFSAGWTPPKVLNFVVAYDGPARMRTVHQWILNAHQAHGIPLPFWTEDNRTSVPGTALDGIFVLGKGFVKLDNTPFGLVVETQATGMHTICDSTKDNLLFLFVLLQDACNSLEGAWLDAGAYLRHVSYEDITIV
jgi:hypothetical protein